MKKFKTVSVDNMNSLLGTEDALLLDCRRVNDYKLGHIENALHAHDALVESLIRSENKSRNMVIYCYHGHTSEHLAELLANFGYTDVYSVEGGFDQWKLHQKAAQ